MSTTLSGRVLLGACVESLSISTDYPEIDDDDTARMVGSMLQDLQDFSDVWDDLRVPDRIDAERTLSGVLRELAAAGLVVFVGRRTLELIADDDTTSPWPEAVVIVMTAAEADRLVEDGGGPGRETRGL